MTYYQEVFTCAAGQILLTVDESGKVTGIRFLTDSSPECIRNVTENAMLPPGGLRRTAKAHKQLEEYFAGQRRRFDLPLALGGTAFQREVWRELMRIPYGETRSYRQIAEALGRPGAARAVGRAVGANRLLVVVPCHRVIGANGGLKGFAGGLAAKGFLLKLEGQAR